MNVELTHQLARCLAIISNLNGKKWSLLDDVDAKLCCQAGWAETTSDGAYVITQEGDQAQNEFWASHRPHIVVFGPLKS